MIGEYLQMKDNCSWVFQNFILVQVVSMLATVMECVLITDDAGEF
jgi:hypothetical protein